MHHIPRSLIEARRGWRLPWHFLWRLQPDERITTKSLEGLRTLPRSDWVGCCEGVQDGTRNTSLRRDKDAPRLDSPETLGTRWPNPSVKHQMIQTPGRKDGSCAGSTSAAVQ